MFVYFMIMLYIIRLCLCINFYVEEVYHLVTPSIMYRSSPMRLFPKLKSYQYVWLLQALNSVIYQTGLPKSVYRGAFQKLIQRLKLCISSRREFFEGMYCTFQILSGMLLKYGNIQYTLHIEKLRTPQ